MCSSLEGKDREEAVIVLFTARLQFRLGVYPALDAGLQFRQKSQSQNTHRAFRFHPAVFGQL